MKRKGMVFLRCRKNSHSKSIWFTNISFNSTNEAVKIRKHYMKGDRTNLADIYEYIIYLEDSIIKVESKIKTISEFLLEKIREKDNQWLNYILKC